LLSAHNDTCNEVILSSKAFATKDPQKYLLTEIENPTVEQKQLRDWWMKTN
jgi:hypothetical protein